MLLHTATPLAILKREILSSLLHCIDSIAYFSDEILKQAFKVQQFIRDETRCYQPFWPLTSYKKQCVVGVTFKMCTSFWQLHQIVIFPSKLLTCFHFNKCSNDPIFQQQSKIREKSPKTENTFVDLNFVFSSFPLIISAALTFICWPFGGAPPLGWEPLD